MNAVDDIGATPLHRAAQYGNDKVAKVSPRRRSGRQLSRTMRRCLLKTERTLTLQITTSGRCCTTPPITTEPTSCRFVFCSLYAFMAPRAPTLRTFSQLLIDLGADVTAVTDEDWTALHVAARYGHKEIAKVTLAAFWCLDCGSCPTDSARRRCRRRPFDRLRLDTLASRLVRRAL